MHNVKLYKKNYRQLIDSSEWMSVNLCYTKLDYQTLGLVSNSKKNNWKK